MVSNDSISVFGFLWSSTCSEMLIRLFSWSTSAPDTSYPIHENVIVRASGASVARPPASISQFSRLEESNSKSNDGCRIFDTFGPDRCVRYNADL